MIDETKIKINQKVIIGLLVGLLFLSGILIIAYKYLESFNQTSRILNTNPLGQSEVEEISGVDSEKLANEYLTERNRIVGDFLILTETKSGTDLSLSARETQSQLLNLVLPAEYREAHLTTVLLLSEISELAETDNETALNNKIEVLRNLISS
jgi:hypothetical protein